MTESHDDVEIYAREEVPFNMSWEGWAEKWWNWAVSIPKDRNPVYDNSGKNSNLDQDDPNVWFLAGAQSGSTTRSCTIPAGKAILVPVAVNECSLSEFPDETDLAECATAGNKVISMKVTVNGKSFDRSVLEKYHVKTGEFNLTFAPNNIFDASPGTTRAVSDGYWFFLRPLSGSRNLDLQLSQKTQDDDRSRTINCSYEVTYHLTLK